MTRQRLVLLILTVVAALPLSAALTISGTIQRTYQANNCGQFSGCTCSETTATAAVRHATVEIRNSSNTKLATTSTNASGAFSISVSSLTAPAGFKLIVWAETAAAVVYPAGTTNRIGAQFTWTSSQSPMNTGTLTVNDVVPDVRAALHLMDNAIKAYQYSANRGLSMSQAVIFMNAAGTDYNSGNNQINVQSSQTWRDGVIHEYGHFIDDSLSPFRGVGYIGGQHDICQKFDNAPEGAFAEGWGNYIVSAVTNRVYFIGFWCSVEAGRCTEKSRNIEGNVAAVLWDLHDGANESFDTISNEYQKVWNVVDGFNFTNPSLETFMADYNDSRADAIECQYTGQKCETVKPVVSSFTVTPTSVATGNSITASWTVSDSGGSGLNTVELWRAPDNGGTPNGNAWTRITFTNVSGNGPVSGSLNDTPPQGTFWYGVHAIDKAGNRGFEPSPPGPVRVIVGAQPCSYSRTPSSRSVTASSGTGTVQITGSPTGCTGSWSSFVASGGTFLSLTGTTGGSGPGSWNVPYSYSQNTLFSSRQGTISFSGSFSSGTTFTLTQDAAAQPQCSFTITPQTANGAGTGGTGSIQVSGSPANCTGSWSASSGATFLSLTGTASGSGPGTWQVPYSYSQNPSTSSTRQGSIVFSGAFPGGGTFTLTQQPSSPAACSYSFTPASASGAGSGGTGSVQVTGSPAGCSGSWSAANVGTFISLTGTSSGSSSGTWQVPYSYSANPSTSSTRQGWIVFNGTFPNGDTFVLTQQPSSPPACSFSITPQIGTGAGNGGTASVQVTGSPGGCVGSWSASSAAAFITLTGTASGSGSSSTQVPFSYSQNPSTSSTRQGWIVFNGSFPNGGTFTLTQEPASPSACSYAISPQSATGAGNGGTGSIQVTGSPANCSGSWSAISGAAAFIALTGTNGGSGSGTWQVPYSYAQNPSTSSTRQLTVLFNGSFPGGGTFTLNQQPAAPGACSYAITPQSAIGAGTGGTGSIQVTGSPANCTGSWSAVSGAAFLTLTGTTAGSGSGTWQVPYSYPQNPGLARQGTILFNGSFPDGGTFTLSQSPASTCSFTITPQSASGAGNGGTGSIQVTGSPANCAGSWSVSSGAAFITMTGITGGGGASTWQVPYAYTQNPSTSSTRQGTILFGGSFPGGGTFTLTQQPAQPTNLPNLTPFNPSGWSDRIVVSRISGTSTDTVMRPGDTLYLDWAVTNAGPVSTPPMYWVDLLIDGSTYTSWWIDYALDSGWYMYVPDLVIGALSPGRHTITIVADPTNLIAESNESDNSYTRTVVVGPTVHGDVNADGKSDIFWRNRNTGMALIWSMPAEGVLQTLSPYPRNSGTDYQLAGVGELGGPFHTADLLWRRTSTRQLSTQLMSGGAPSTETVWPLTPTADLIVNGVADLDGDGLAESILRSTQTGETTRWSLDGFGVQKVSIHPGGNLSWNIVAIRDFDGDTRADILWRDSATGMTLTWFMKGSMIRSSEVVHQGANNDWTIAAAADFDGDSKCDLFWRQPSSGMTILWLMDGAVIRSSTLVHPGGNQGWTIAASGDFDGDGRADILWRENATGQTLYWGMNGAGIAKSVALHMGGNLDWDIVAPR